MVIDDADPSSSSRVAAGLINPLSGLRFVYLPLVSAWLAVARQVYGELEVKSGCRLWHPLPMLRVFHQAEQASYHNRARQTPHARELIGPHLPQDALNTLYKRAMHAPYGGAIQQNTGYLDIPALLDCCQALLRADDLLASETFDLTQLKRHENQLMYGGETYCAAILCTGYQAATQQATRNLPWLLDQGDIIDLHGPALPDTHIVNAAQWLLPHGQGYFRFGATHAPGVLDRMPSEQAKEQLRAGFNRLFPATGVVDIAQHRTGVRLSVRDRYPAIGRLQQSILMFNGFGARGALTIPWYADRMVAWLCDGRALPTHSNIQRLNGHV